ncbi:BRX1 protein, partial [Polypterus senegalus]
MAAFRKKRGAPVEHGKKSAKKRKISNVKPGKQEEVLNENPENEYSIPPPLSLGKWKNKERVLIFSSRGINFRTRHMMQDLRTLMPHSKAVHTLAELKMTGNCLRGSRPVLSFDPKFDSEPHYAVLKELFIQIFATPQYHPKSQPFVDHVLTFTIADNRIWFRNYQIIEEDSSLVEIGPRFVLNLIKIFSGSFRGSTLYENPHYMSPNLSCLAAENEKPNANIHLGRNAFDEDSINSPGLLKKITDVLKRYRLLVR